VIGTAFDALAPPVRAMHHSWRECGAVGRADVLGAGKALGRLVARIMRFPPPASHALHIGFVEEEGVASWTRSFSGYRFSSHPCQQGRHLVSRFGPIRFRFDLMGVGSGLKTAIRAWSMFGAPLPPRACPAIAGTRMVSKRPLPFRRSDQSAADQPESCITVDGLNRSGMNRRISSAMPKSPFGHMKSPDAG